jgi:hypothetical protein
VRVEIAAQDVGTGASSTQPLPAAIPGRRRWRYKAPLAIGRTCALSSTHAPSVLRSEQLAKRKPPPGTAPGIGGQVWVESRALPPSHEQPIRLGGSFARDDWSRRLIWSRVASKFPFDKESTIFMPD